jgi:phage-related protein (TIGR01555 family)
MPSESDDQRGGATRERATRMDDWQNASTHLGTALDKATKSRYHRRMAKNDQELEALFDFDDMAHTLVTAEPEGMLRKGFEVKLDDLEATSRLDDQLETLGLHSTLLEALIAEGVYGGAAILIGADDGQTVDKPLVIERVRSVKYLVFVDPRDLVPRTHYNDPLSPKFGKAETYDMGSTHRVEGGSTAGTRTVVHESRFVLFFGGKCSTALRRERQGWGASKIDRAYKALQIFSDNWASASHIMADGAQGVYSMKGLIKMLGGPHKNIALERMRQVDRSRSVARAMFLDGDEESFERKDTTKSGLPEMLDRTSHRLAASARMPVSVLMGREPSGLNATGEMDMRSWYDQLASGQKHNLTPKIRRIVRILTAADDGPTGGVIATKIDVRFPPVWTPTPKERAEIEQMHATTDQTRIASRVAFPEQIAIARFRPEGYQDEINLDMGALEKRVEELLVEVAKGEELPPTPAVPDDSPEAKGSGVAPTAAEPQALAPEAAKDPSTALNGAQVTSLVGIVTAVATGQIPRETGIGIILAAFPLERAQVEEIMGTVGKGFVPAAEPTGAPALGAP